MRKKILVTMVIMLGIVMTLIYAGVTDTYSKYVGQVQNKTATAKIAKWRFELNGSNELLNIDLDATLTPNPYSTTHVIPGTTGQIDLIFDSVGTEVGVNYNVYIDKALSNMPENIKLYSDNTYKTEIDKFSFIVNSVNSAPVTKKIYWKWNFTDTDENAWSGKEIEMALIAEAVQR